MKILCNYTPCGPSYVRNGWRRVFEHLGHTFRFWEVDKEPAFDVFSEFEPDAYIGATYEVNRAIVKNIKTRPHMKVAMYCSAWSDYIDSIDKTKYPIVCVNEQEKRILAQLKEATGKPDFVFLHGTESTVEKTLSGWKSIGIEPSGILNAADIFTYYPAEQKSYLKCDIGYVGGMWGYKSRNLNKYMLPLCNTDLNVKIFGNQSWPVAQYLGQIEDSEVKHLFSSAKICVSVSESHSTDLGFDCIERPFKVMASGGFCISDYVEEFRELYSSDELLMYKNEEEFMYLIKTFLDDEEARKEYIKRGYMRTIAEHTYFDRVAKMLDKLDMIDESTKCLEAKRLFVNSLPIPMNI